jgi:hypothetical protein
MVSEKRSGARARLDDDLLRNAYRLAHVTPSGPHVSESQWEQLTCGELDQANRDRVLEHVFSCDHCQQVHRSLLQVSAESSAFDGHTGRPAGAPPIARTWMYLAGLAAAAAIVAAAVIDLRPLRTDNAADVNRTTNSAASIALTSPGADRALEDRRLAWQPVENADAYDVRVNAADGGAIWTARVGAPSAVLPTDVAMPPGRYYWQVDALREGTIVGTSAIGAFRVE